MAIRSVLPVAGLEVDPLVAVAEEPRPRSGGRPWVLTNMVTSIDGATAVGGVSGPLGGPADMAVFRAIRSVADAVIVGAGTAVAENYRPPRPDTAVAAARQAQGRAERLTIAVVTASLNLDPSLALFNDSAYRPLIITVEQAPEQRRSVLEQTADIVVAGVSRVDLRLALDELSRRGHKNILVEGGPSLNGQFIAGDLIDEWNLTLSPVLAGGNSARPAFGPQAATTRRLTLARLWQGDDLLFGRWVRAGTSSG